jgi:hypothetical protein
MLDDGSAVDGDNGQGQGQGVEAPGAAATPERAAQILFQEPRSEVAFDAQDEAEARRAVEEFAQLFYSAPGVFKRALDGARAGAETLSGDRLQGLAEIIQNADDEGATSVSFRLVRDHLVAEHDGRLVTFVRCSLVGDAVAV